MRRFVFLFVLASALTLIATVAGSSSGAPGPAVVGAGTITGCISPGPCALPPASFAVSARQSGGEYAFTSQSSILLGRAQCVFQSGNFAAVGGTITASTAGSIVGQHFAVYFSEQTTTRPDIDPESNPGESLPRGFPNKCPSNPPSNDPFYPLLSGSITYAP
jgi:hypothetical protein